MANVNNLIFKHHKLAISILLFIGFMAGTGVFAQSSYSPSISNPISETWRWRLVENLTARGVRCMTSDQQGNMWFGLNNGVIRYGWSNWVMGTLFDTNLLPASSFRTDDWEDATRAE